VVPEAAPRSTRRGLVWAVGAGALATFAIAVVSLFFVGGEEKPAAGTSSTRPPVTAPTTTTATSRATTTTISSTVTSSTSTTSSTRATTTTRTATTATSFGPPMTAAPEPGPEPAPSRTSPSGTTTTQPPSGPTTSTSTTQPSSTTTTTDQFVQQWRWKGEDDPARRKDGFTNLPVLQWNVVPSAQVEVLDPNQQVLSRANSGELAVCPGTVTAQSGQPPVCQTGVQQETTYIYTLRVLQSGQEVRKVFLHLIVTP